MLAPFDPNVIHRFMPLHRCSGAGLRSLACALLALGALVSPGAAAQLLAVQLPAAAAKVSDAGSPVAQEQLGDLPRVLPEFLPGFNEGLRTIVAEAEAGRPEMALLWTAAYLGLGDAEQDMGREAGAPAGSTEGADTQGGSAPSPVSVMPTAPSLSEYQRASLHYAMGVLLAGEPTTDAPADETAEAMLLGRELAAIDQFHSAASLAGPGALRADATFNRSALSAWRGERGLINLLRDLVAKAPSGNPFPEDSPEREALLAARGHFEGGRDAALDGLRLAWSAMIDEQAQGLSSTEPVLVDEDLRGNLEFCQRRLREIDRLLELPPEEEQEQEEQQDQESQEDQEDQQDSEDESSSESDSQDSEGEDGEESDSDSEPEPEPESESEQDPQGEESLNDEPEGSDPQNSESGDSESGDGQESTSPTPDSSEIDPESLEERDPADAEPAPAENPGSEAEAEAESDPSKEAPLDTEGANGTAGGPAGEPEEVPLSEEQVMELLRRLADIEKQQGDLRELIRGVRRVPVEKDW